MGRFYGAISFCIRSELIKEDCPFVYFTGIFSILEIVQFAEYSGDLGCYTEQYRGRVYEHGDPFYTNRV